LLQQQELQSVEAAWVSAMSARTLIVFAGIGLPLTATAGATIYYKVI
jgi:hypothetical protein